MAGASVQENDGGESLSPVLSSSMRSSTQFCTLIPVMSASDHAIAMHGEQLSGE